MIAFRNFVALGLVAVLAACSSAPATSPSQAEPSASARVQGGIPPGCAPIDLRSPTGERVDLTGEWTGSATLFNATEVVLLNEVGGCIYGSVTGSDPDGSETVSTLSGRLSSDFTIEFEVVIVHQDAVFGFGEYTTMVMFIEWDDEGRIRLREDRAPGETAARCTQAAFECPVPVVWYRLDDSPPS
jgi:hypothetical protein